MATATKLKYLFHVQYYDGGGFIQTQDDVSKTNPTKSQYYDVEQNKVEYFELLIGDGDTAGVNLGTGEFWIATDMKYSFTVGEPGPKPYKLIFYRQHTHNFNTDREELSHIIQYCIGYTDSNGVEHKIYLE